MSETGPPTPEEDDRVLIGEYVLGLLSPEAARAVEDRMAREPALRDLHADWEASLAPLLRARPVEPPPHLEAAIAARLFPVRRRAAVAKWLALFGVPVAAFVLALLAVQPQLRAPAPALDAEMATDGETEGAALRFAASVTGDILIVLLVLAPAVLLMMTRG